MTGLADAINAQQPASNKLGRIADLLERNGIDVDDIGKVQKISVYQGFYKSADGEAHKVDLTGITLSPKWAEGPAWPVVQPAAPIKVPAPGRFSTTTVWPRLLPISVATTRAKKSVPPSFCAKA